MADPVVDRSKIPAGFDTPLTQQTVNEAPRVDKSKIPDGFDTPMNRPASSVAEADKQGWGTTLKSFLSPDPTALSRSWSMVKERTGSAWGDLPLGTFNDPKEAQRQIDTLPKDDDWASRLKWSMATMYMPLIQAADAAKRTLQVAPQAIAAAADVRPYSKEDSQAAQGLLEGSVAFAGMAPGSLGAAGGFGRALGTGLKITLGNARIGIVKMTGGLHDAPNFVRARDTEFIGPVRPELPITATPAQEAAMRLRSPSEKVVAPYHFDADVPRGPTSEVPLNNRPGVMVTPAGVHFNPEGPQGPSTAVGLRPGFFQGPDGKIQFDPKAAKGPTSKVSGLGIETPENPPGLVGAPQGGLTFNPDAARGPTEPVRVHLDPVRDIVDAEMKAPEKLRSRLAPEAPKGSTMRQVVEAVEDKHGADAVGILEREGIKGVRDDEGVRVLNPHNVERDINEYKPPADRVADDLETLPDSEVRRAGNLRTDLIGVNEDMKTLMEKGAREANDFEHARATGEVPPEHLKAISDVTGTPVSVLRERGHGENKIVGTQRIRDAYGALISSLHVVHDSSIVASVKRDVASLSKFASDWMRHQYIQEYASGLTAEAGRTLQALQDFIKDFTPGYKEEAAMAAKQDALKQKALSRVAKGDDTSLINKMLKDEGGAIQIDSEGLVIPKTKDQILQEWLQRKFGEGATLDRLQNAADHMAKYDPRISRKQLVEFLKSGIAEKMEYTRSDYWYERYRISILSGLGTHLEYFQANPMIVFRDAAVKSVRGGIYQALDKLGVVANAENASVRDGFYHVTGFIQSVPEALKAGLSGMVRNWHIPTPGELAKMERGGFAELPKDLADKAKAHAADPKKNPALTPAEWGQALPTGMTQSMFDKGPTLRFGEQFVQQGVQRGLAGIHTTQRWIGYGTQMTAEAIKQAHEEGLSSTTGSFWQRVEEIKLNATPDMVERANAYADRVAHTMELGPVGKALNAWVLKMPGARWIDPLRHVTQNIVKLVQEVDPVFGYATSSQFRADLRGANGTEARINRSAQVTVGVGIMLWGIHKQENGELNGYGPTEPKARAEWLNQGNSPYSIKFSKDGDWHSLLKFGVLGVAVGLNAQLHDVTKQVYRAGEQALISTGDMEKAAKHLKEATTGTLFGLAQVLDTAGLQTATKLVGAFGSREGDSVVGQLAQNFAVSNLPASSFLRQWASAFDPHQREINNVIEATYNIVPGLRNKLDTRNDWLNEPKLNPRYGLGMVYPGLPDHKTPLGEEMARLDVKPTPMPNHLRGVLLTPQLHREYQEIFAGQAKAFLEDMVSRPEWKLQKPAEQKAMMEKSIGGFRRAADGLMAAKHPEIIQQYAQDVNDWWTGAKGHRSPINLFDRPPLDRGQ